MDVPTPRDDRMKELVLEKEEMEKKHSAELELMEDRVANLAWEKGQMDKEFKEEKELLEDRMKELKEETEKKKSTDDDDGGSALAATKRGLAKGSADNKPVSKKQKKRKTKEPTQEHHMIRVKYEALVKWEREMQTRYTEGFTAEMMARIASNGKMEQFPSEIPHMWTKELVVEAKVGWQKYKETLEVSDKYVKQSTEQWYKEDTDEWIMLDN
jgi:hypothetical protein